MKFFAFSEKYIKLSFLSISSLLTNFNVCIGSLNRSLKTTNNFLPFIGHLQNPPKHLKIKGLSSVPAWSPDTIWLAFTLPSPPHKSKNLITNYNGERQSENYDVCANLLYWRTTKMAKIIFEEIDGTDTDVNGYLISNLTLPTQKEKPIGIWRRYLRDHKKAACTTLLTSLKLYSSLADIDKGAVCLFFGP